MSSLSPEFTLRAVITGVVVGAMLCIGNVYMGLKTGWWDSGNITATVLGFALLAPIARRMGRPYSLFENNITQTVAGSAAIMPGVLGLLGALPALELLGHHYSSLAIGAWGLSLGLFGVLLGIPLRQRFVISKPLPFPSAIATAAVIRGVHSSSDEAWSRTRALLASALFAMAFTWVRDGRPVLVPGTLWLPLPVAGIAAESLTLGLAMSPMLVGVGALVGARSGFSLCGGSILAWAVIAPVLVRSGVVHADYSSLVSWLLWPGVALMVSSGLAGLIGQWRAFAKMLSDLAALRVKGRARTAWALPVASGILVVLLTWVVFGVHPLVGALVLVASIALIDVCVRTAGETDIAPLGAIGQLVQLLFAFFGPGNAVTSIACASVPAGAGGQAALTVNSLKAGHAVAAPVRGQVRAQVVGVVAGVLVALPAYVFVRNAHGIGSAFLPAPAALGWRALAEIGERGGANMPPWAGAGAALGGATGVVLSLLERTRAARFLPSAVALAVAFLVPASTGAAIGLGTLVWVAAKKRNPDTAERFVSSWAAGGIAGESLVGIVTAALLAAGMLSRG